MTARSADRLVVHGELRVPGDKSVSHRALMFASLAVGRSHIRRILQSDDIASTARVLSSLGVALPAISDEITVEGKGPSALRAPRSELYCGNSGTTARLMLGILAARPFPATVTGDASLSRRPMRRVTDPLTAMGARVELFAGQDGLPLRIYGGNLTPIEWHLEVASAQVKSAILLAGLCAGVPVVVQEPTPSRDHSERFLRLQGADLRTERGRVELRPSAALGPFEMEVPADPSAAAFFAALGALADDGELVLRDVDLNPGRSGFFEALRRMGPDVTIAQRGTSGPEPIGDVAIRPRELRGITVSAEEVPSLIDELPMLACLAARAEGDTVIEGASELRVKESDRIAVVVENLRTIGVAAEEFPDGMRITGSPGALSGYVRTYHDHRVAMAFGILGACAACDITVDDPECVAVSYPGFWRDLERVTKRA